MARAAVDNGRPAATARSLDVKALIKVGYGCNDHCTFCHTLDVRHIDGEAREVHEKIDRARALGHTMVVLSGGEPTIRPELVAWARHTASLDMDFGLVTNGRMLSYEPLVEKLLEQRLKYVYLSLHGGTAKIHNLMVRSDAFEQTYGAVQVLSGRGLDFTVNCVITRHNMEHLRAVVDALLPYPDVGLKFSMVEPKGGGLHLFDHVIPRVTEVAERVMDALEYADRRSGGSLRVTHGAIPLCHLPGREHLFDDLKTDGFATMVEIGEPDFFPVDDRNKVQPGACRRCSLRGSCPGLYRVYHERFGGDEVRPRGDRVRSNSFNYTFTSMVPPAGETCPVLAQGVTAWDRGRHLFVRNGQRIARFTAATRDFADVEIEEIKHELGQVYLDVTRKSAPDDFASDLVQLRRAATCQGCPEFDHCTGLFEPVHEPVFERDDGRVREILGSLEGRVLDLGCGEGPYVDLLAPMVESGTIEYVGVDPDADALRNLARRWPGADLRTGAAEALASMELGRFDHILILRSWNHLRDPRRVLGTIRELLAPGGTLLIVDNVAFGLARTEKQTRRAEAGPAGFEHFRNDGAAEAHGDVEPLGLQLVERADVTPRSSNQWLLRYAAV